MTARPGPAAEAVGPGRLMFVTGASSGIGQALALEWARRGGRLALVARRAEALHDWAAQQGWGPDRVRIYAADVRDTGAITEAGRACIAAQGLPDVVVANAGISVGFDAGDERDLDVLRTVLETNNLGLAATFAPFVEPMRARGRGRLVGVASVAGLRGLPGHVAYCMSKAGVIAFCESLRVECRSSGVRVVTLVPGYVDTPLTRGNRYRMPFLMPVDAFARAAIDAIERGASRRVIPWQMGAVATLLRLLPDALFDRLLERRPRKRRHDH